jgi:hypothetical protein
LVFLRWIDFCVSKFGAWKFYFSTDSFARLLSVLGALILLRVFSVPANPKNLANSSSFNVVALEKLGTRFGFNFLGCFLKRGFESFLNNKINTVPVSHHRVGAILIR